NTLSDLTSQNTSHSNKFYVSRHSDHPHLHSFPTRRSSDLRVVAGRRMAQAHHHAARAQSPDARQRSRPLGRQRHQLESIALEQRSEEHTSELQSLRHLVCRLLLEKKKKKQLPTNSILPTLL